MDEQAVQRDVLIAFEYSYKHDDWVNPLADALAGVTAAEAAWRPGPDLKGIWNIVLHMAVWTENIVERMRSGERVRPAEGAWPPPPADHPSGPGTRAAGDAAGGYPDEAAWEAAQRRLWDALAALQAYIETNTLDALAGSPYGLGDLFCRFIHNAYHIGQITKMRELRAAQDATA
jgi:hypothetical protein